MSEACDICLHAPCLTPAFCNASRAADVPESTLDQQTRSHDDQALIRQLATLSRLIYEQRRLGAAQELGIRAPVLDKLVRDARVEAEEFRIRVAALECRAVGS